MIIRWQFHVGETRANTETLKRFYVCSISMATKDKAVETYDGR